jgi:hypothetical protein
MLFKILTYIQQEKWVSEQQLTRAFQISSEALQPMLERWVKKGRIQKIMPTLPCQRTCVQCQEGTLAYYQPASLLTEPRPNVSKTEPRP